MIERVRCLLDENCIVRYILKMKSHDVNLHGDLYSQLQKAASVFNAELFDGQLPAFVFTLQRRKDSSGYFSPDQWGNKNGEFASEIAINPSCLTNQSLLILFQIMVHELCHLWQHTYGSNKPRVGYHNQEWAEKMMQIGLIPSDTGEAGGKKTGQKMADYPLPNGKFMEVCKCLVNSGFWLDWVDRDFSANMVSHRSMPKGSTDKLNLPLRNYFPALNPLVKAGREEKKKIRYSCPKCEMRVWGKPDLWIKCMSCNRKLVRAKQ